MCVVVELAVSATSFWCRRDASIRVPPHLTRPQMLLLARSVLQELGTRQPSESTMEARCYCGVPLKVRDMPDISAVVPRQRVYREAEAHHGS